MSYAPPHYPEDHPAHKLAYRPCVGALIVNDHGQVFSGRRVKGDLPDDAPRWQWPQGGIDADENPLCAAYREVEEETGITDLSLIYELPYWLTYDLPEALIGRVLKGKYRGQRQKWFAFRFTGDEAKINLAGHEQIEFDHWLWRPIEECVDLIVPFKRPVYRAVAEAFTPFLRPQVGRE